MCSITEGMRARILRGKEMKQSFYKCWVKETIFYFIVLSRYMEYSFSYGIHIPIEVIRYILIIYLKYDQQLLDPLFQYPFQCKHEKCIIKWWNMMKWLFYTHPFSSDVIKTPLYINRIHFGDTIAVEHCSKQLCHNISNSYKKCNCCNKMICSKCIDREWQVVSPDNIYNFVCDECKVIKNLTI